MELDPFRLSQLQEEAFHNACSISVIDTVRLANRLIGKENERMLMSLDSDDLQLDNPKLKYTLNLTRTFQENEDDCWINIIIQDVNSDEQVTLASFQDRSGDKQCSIAIIEAGGVAAKIYDDLDKSTVVTTDDEKTPLFLEEDGQLRYTKEAVVVFYNIIAKTNQPSVQKEFLELFKIKEIITSSFDQNLSFDILQKGEQTKLYPYNLSRSEYFVSTMASELAKIAIGQSVTLSKESGNSERQDGTNGDTSQYVTKTNLIKNGETLGQLDWVIQFGPEGYPVGEPVNYMPSVCLDTKASRDSQLVSVIDYSPEYKADQRSEILAKLGIEDSNLSYEQAKAILDLSAKYKFPKVIELPEVDEVLEYTHDFLNRIKLSSTDQTLNELAGIKAWCFNSVDETQLYARLSFFETAIRAFNSTFMTEGYLLNLGYIELPAINHAEHRGFLERASNIMAHIKAPGWTVLSESTFCSGVIVEDADSAFIGAKNISFSETHNVRTSFTNGDLIDNCKVINAYDAFTFANRVKNSTAENCDVAFLIDNRWTTNKVTDLKGIITNCEAINCDEAFELKYKNYRPIRKFRRRQLVQNSRWVSQPGRFTSKPHRVVNQRRGRKAKD